jgi:hypothetical protein
MNYNVILWRVRIMFIPPRPSEQPPTVSLAVPDFNQIWVYPYIYIKTPSPPPNIFHGNPPNGNREHTDMMEVMGAFCNYANAPINYVSTVLVQLSNV